MVDFPLTCDDCGRTYASEADAINVEIPVNEHLSVDGYVCEECREPVFLGYNWLCRIPVLGRYFSQKKLLAMENLP